jgi:hypothetical protein
MAKKYQKRPDDVALRAWSRGYLTPLDLFRVAAWKTGQGLGSLTVNTEEEIEARTRAAVDCVQPWRERPVSRLADDTMREDWRETARHAIGALADRSGLLGLKSAGYPMATAILDILDPGVWPVMDRWAIITVFGTRRGGPPVTWHPVAARQCVPVLRPAPGYARRSSVGFEPLGARTGRASHERVQDRPTTSGGMESRTASAACVSGKS